LPAELVQSDMNIGTIGHVDHGKTTLVQALTGVWASRHSEELRRGITIKLGYADAVFYKCPACPPPQCYTTDRRCQFCGGEATPLRKVSFVDAPGHEALMATMLAGAAVMDGVIFVIGADEPCPQPQTREHMLAARIMGIKNMVVAQNKIDLVTRERAVESYGEIKKFLAGTEYEEAPIIPVSAQRRINIDALTQAVQEHLPTPERDPSLPPLMMTVRTFDVNRPGTPITELKGGVLGGTLSQGMLEVGDEVEVKPGARVRKGESYITIPLSTVIASLRIGEMEVERVGCGGLVGAGTRLDPALTKGDGLVGNLVGRPGTLPPAAENLRLSYSLFNEVVGMRESLPVEPIKVGEALAFNVGVAVTSGRVVAATQNNMEVRLTRPVAPTRRQRVAVSRNVAGRWRLIGHGATLD